MTAQNAPVIIVCALETELAHLRSMLSPTSGKWCAGRPVWLTELSGQSVILALSGLGMIAAATATEALIGQYLPAAVLNFGCAGAHRRDLLPGDMVIGSSYVAYDSMREHADGSEHYAGTRYMYRGECRKVPALPAAPALLASALRAAALVESRLDAWPPMVNWPAAVPSRSPTVTVGTIASADRWNRTTARIEVLAATHDSLCEDMEAAAIAMTCASHDVLFLAVKDISNNELLHSTVSGQALGAKCGAEIGKRAAALTFAILQDLAYCSSAADDPQTFPTASAIMSGQ